MQLNIQPAKHSYPSRLSTLQPYINSSLPPHPFCKSGDARTYAEVTTGVLGPPPYNTRPFSPPKHPPTFPSPTATLPRKTSNPQLHAHTVPKTSSMIYKANIDNLAWLQRSAVGTVTSPAHILNLKEVFSRYGFHDIAVAPLGGYSVLLSFRSTETMENFLAHPPRWLHNWLESLSPWNPSSNNTDRFTWLKCYGTPPQVWNSDFFKSLCCCVGKYVRLDKATETKSRLDVARVLINTSVLHFINHSCTVSIDGEKFPISIIEDPTLDPILSLHSSQNPPCPLATSSSSHGSPKASAPPKDATPSLEQSMTASASDEVQDNSQFIDPDVADAFIADVEYRHVQGLSLLNNELSHGERSDQAVFEANQSPVNADFEANQSPVNLSAVHSTSPSRSKEPIISNPNSNLNFERSQEDPLLEPNYLLGPSNFFGPFDHKDPADVMLLESSLPGLVQSSRLKKLANFNRPKATICSPSFPPSRASSYNSGFLIKPRLFKTLKKTGSLCSIDSNLPQTSSSQFFQPSNSLISCNNRRLLLTDSSPSPLSRPSFSSSSKAPSSPSHSISDDTDNIEEEVSKTWEIGVTLGIADENQKEATLHLISQQILEEKEERNGLFPRK